MNLTVSGHMYNVDIDENSLFQSKPAPPKVNCPERAATDRYFGNLFCTVDGLDAL